MQWTRTAVYHGCSGVSYEQVWNTDFSYLVGISSNALCRPFWAYLKVLHVVIYVDRQSVLPNDSVTRVSSLRDAPGRNWLGFRPDVNVP